MINVVPWILALGGLVGAPLFILMSGLALFAFYSAEIDLSAVAVEVYRMSTAPTLVTIPLFTFAGFVLAESRAPKRLLDVADSLLGWMPGGVALVCLFVCAFFTAFTGASGVTIIALGGLIYPILRDQGYSERFSLGLVTTCGSIGLLFPPSLPIILYGIIAKVDIDSLFLAGIIPGFIMIFIIGVYAIKQDRTREKRTFNFRLAVKALISAWPELPIPLIVLGGIYGGFLTANEASALLALYVFMMYFFIKKELKLSSDLTKIVVESMRLVSSILIVLCSALALTNYLVDQEVPLKILQFMRTAIHSPYTFLFVLNIFLLIVGCLMDIFSAIIVVVPLILPIAQDFGINPVHLAIVFLTNLEIGYITPPVGINLFISSFRFEKSVSELYRVSFPFLILSILALLIITYIPWLTLLWLK